MPILRTIKNDVEIYHHKSLGFLVALDSENQKLITQYRKAQKGKKETKQKSKVKGFKFILDKEFQSLKIDFSQLFSFDASELVNTK